MNISEEEIKARRTISNGRLLIFVTAIPLIGSILKLLHFGLPTNKSDELSNILVNPDMYSTILSYFPSLGHSDLTASDNIVSICLSIGLIVGVTTLMKGLSELKQLR